MAVAASSQDDFAGELSVAGIALTIGGLEATFLAWRAWARMQKTIAIVVTVLASCGAIIVFAATSPGVTTAALVLVATGVAMVGFSCAVGLYGVLTGPDSSTPALVTALALVGALAYLAQVLWANGPGAALFGYPDIEAIIDAGDVLPPIARRQLAATAGFPEIGSERAVTLRLTSGMSSHTAALFASTITMPDGEKAILLAAPAVEAEPGKPSDAVARALSGFTADGEFLLRRRPGHGRGSVRGLRLARLLR